MQTQNNDTRAQDDMKTKIWQRSDPVKMDQKSKDDWKSKAGNEKDPQPKADFSR